MTEQNMTTLRHSSRKLVSLGHVRLYSLNRGATHSWLAVGAHRLINIHEAVRPQQSIDAGGAACSCIALALRYRPSQLGRRSTTYVCDSTYSGRRRA